MRRFLIVSMLFMMLVPTAFAKSSNYQTGLHTAKVNANVRLSPNARALRINHLHKGDTVNVKGIVRGWCDIDLKNYKHAYVNCALLETVSAYTGTTVVQEASYADYNGVSVSRNSDGSWALGSKDAKVTIEEFGDMQCPFCGRYFVNTFPKIFTNYIATGKVRYVYYNFPLSFHTGAESGAMASLCAGEQDKYWQMHALILEKQDEWSLENDIVSTFNGYAKTLGLNMDNFSSCMDKEKFGKQISDEIAAAEKRGVIGTPYFFINGVDVMGSQPYETFSLAIEDALKAK